MATHLHLDPFSGIAGDMFLGALVDLGVEVGALRAALAPLPVERSYDIVTRRVSRHGIGAVDLKVRVEPAEHGDGHHHTHYPQLMEMAAALDTTPRGRERAGAVVTALADAEARVHGTPREKVHFHEVGAVDSIVDLLGAAVALELLDIDTLSCGALPISRGFVRCDHGLMPVPAPATAYLMEGLPTVGVDRRGELVTPTGAAIVRAWCGSFGPPPAMTLRGVGYGAGDREDPDVPNLLRVMLGETTPAGKHGPMTPDEARAVALPPVA
ncbi:MAG: LarC family nickel insertion protein [Planctomycetota bacterium]